MALFDAGTFGTNPDTPKPKTPSVKSEKKRAPKGGGYYKSDSGEVKFFPGGRFIPNEFKQSAAPEQVAQHRKDIGAVSLPKIPLASVSPDPPKVEHKAVGKKFKAPSIQPESLPTPTETSSGYTAGYGVVKGRKTREKINAQAKAILASKSTGYTADELEILSKYSGRGGLQTDDASINEYYTRKDLADGMWRILEKHGFTGGLVVEPSCGSGAFLSAGDRKDTKVVGVELDPTSSAVAKSVNPHAEVVNQPFERHCLDNEGVYDAAIGNVPFGTRMVSKDWKANKYKAEWKKNEDLFVDGTLDQLRPDGLMALIVPHGVVTGSDHQALRSELVKKGRVLGCYRLPDSAFKHSDTQVVTDILVIQKHPLKVLNAIKANDETAIAAVQDPNFVGGGYYAEHPELVLGKLGTKSRFNRETITVSGEVTGETLASLPTVQPKVDYAGLNIEPKRLLQVGDERYINGHLYRLNENHRWERVDREESDTLGTASASTDPSAYGTASIDEAVNILSDPGRVVKLSPDTLSAYLSLAKSEKPEMVQRLNDAIAAQAYGVNDKERTKLAHASLLASHVRDLQSHTADPKELERTLAMLEEYKELHGNPFADKQLTKLNTRFKPLLNLQGAFNEAGEISDYFADPEKLIQHTGKRLSSAVADAVGEAYRSTGKPVDTSTVRKFLNSPTRDLSEADLRDKLLADPAIGFLDGYFQPINQLLIGDGYDLVSKMEQQAAGLPDGDSVKRKMDAQAAEIFSRLKSRQIEDMTVPLWMINKWLPVSMVSEFMQSKGFHAIAKDEKGKWYAVGKDGDRATSVWGLEEDTLKYLNREKILHGKDTDDAKKAVRRLEEEFIPWISGTEHRFDLEDIYNRRYCSELPRDYSGEDLQIDKLNPNLKLHDYQASTVKQFADTGRGIIALDVGLGKTATAIALAAHLKQEGRADKPCIVCPKSVLANWVREIGVWSPNANVIVVGQTQQFWKDGSPAWEVPGLSFVLNKGNPVIGEDGRYLLKDKEGTEISLTEAEVKKAR
ncbi:MAG: N-6 DNA methylase [Desertifilum sp.]|nr:N-6 DNA methylase [Desertifilum sp.]